MSQLSLYPGYKDGGGFIIDTMVMVGIGRTIYPDEIRASAKQIVDSMVKDGEAISSTEVYDEVYFGHAKGDGDSVCTIAETYKEQGAFEKLTEEDQANVAVILQEFPNFVKYKSEKPDADPWLVALAMRKPNFTIVSRDGAKDTRHMKRMKQVCDHFGIQCITDYEFYKMHGWNL